LAVNRGERAHLPTLSCAARRRASGAFPRAGFTATKKIGNAVIRNRARRRLKEAAALLVPPHGIAGVDYVFFATEATAEAPWPALLDDMKTALIRLAAKLSGPPRPRARKAPAEHS
jgi:ribonuclease P protein component